MKTGKDGKTMKLTLKDVRVLEDLHGRAARDFAAELLGGDPFQAEDVASEVFCSLIGRDVDKVAPAEKMPAWIADQVVRRCLVLTGNGVVADWGEYLFEHPEARKKTPRPSAEVAQASRLRYIAGGKR